jgi:hypothetical protein
VGEVKAERRHARLVGIALRCHVNRNLCFLRAIQANRAVDEQPQHLRLHLHPRSGIEEAKFPIIGLELIQPINHLVPATFEVNHQD